jgi:hypothetical protein
VERLLCQRCGNVLDSRRRRNEVFCGDCRAKPAKTVKYGSEVCIPWRGEFDDDDNPIFNGLPYMPGVRHCGHKDCVNGNHQLD